MSGAIARFVLTGGAFLLLAAFVAASASESDDDLPDLGEQVERMASEVALELQRVCPPASSSDQTAFDLCRRSLFGDFSAAAQSRAAASMGAQASGCGCNAQGNEPYPVRARM